MNILGYSMNMELNLTRNIYFEPLNPFRVLLHGWVYLCPRISCRAIHFKPLCGSIKTNNPEGFNE